MNQRHLFALLGSAFLVSAALACSGEGGGNVDGGVTGGSATAGGSSSVGGSTPATGGEGNLGTGGVPGSGGGGPLVPTGPLSFGYIYNLEALGGTGVLTTLPYANVDVVVHAFVTADSAGNVVGVDYFDNYRAAGLADAVHAAGKKIVLSLGGAGSTAEMAALLGTPAQATFVANVANKIEEWGYDGVDFDYEFPGQYGTAAQFTDFLQQLRTAVKAKNPNHIVMFGVSPGYYIKHYEWATLGGVADYAFYFCYDWNNPERGPMTKPGSSQNLDGGGTIEASCRGALDFILGQGFPANRMIVGLPFAANGGAPYRTASDAVKNGTPNADSMEVSDGAGGWWPNAASMTMKVNAVVDPAQSVLANGATVAGVGFWEWGEENATSGADLSTAIRTRLDQL